MKKLSANKKLIIYKVAVIALALLFMFYPGVADKQPQIDSRVMVTSIGFDDYEDGKLMLTAVVTVPASGGTSGKETTASADGDTIGESIANLSRALGKNATLSHCGMVAFGRELCMRGIEREISYLVASGLISDGASVIAADGKAQELIDTAAGLSEAAAFSLGSFLSFAVENAQIPMMSLLRFASASESKGKSAYMPIIKMGPGGDQSGKGEQGGEQGGSQGGGQSGGQGGEQGEGSGGSGESGQSGGGQGQSSQGEEAQILSSDKTLIFKDYRAECEFDKDATMSITWQDSQSDRGLIKLDKFEFKGENLGPFTFRMKKKGVKIKAKWNGDSPAVRVCVDAQLEIEDSHRLSEKQQEGYTEQELMMQMRKSLSEKFDKEILTGWEKAVENKVDPFKFGYNLYKKNPKTYERVFAADDDVFDVLRPETEIKLLII